MGILFFHQKFTMRGNILKINGNKGVGGVFIMDFSILVGLIHVIIPHFLNNYK